MPLDPILQTISESLRLKNSLNKVITSPPFINCTGGSVVEFSPATREARVRFPASAHDIFFPLSKNNENTSRSLEMCFFFQKKPAYVFIVVTSYVQITFNPFPPPMGLGQYPISYLTCMYIGIGMCVCCSAAPEVWFLSRFGLK